MRGLKRHVARGIPYGHSIELTGYNSVGMIQLLRTLETKQANKKKSINNEVKETGGENKAALNK